jgi:hypothetical protein
MEDNLLTILVNRDSTVLSHFPQVKICFSATPLPGDAGGIYSLFCVTPGPSDFLTPR